MLKVLVNPVKTIKKRRVPLKGYSQVKEWLDGRTEEWGFHFTSQVNISGSIDFRSRKKNVYICGSYIEGFIEIRNQSRFEETFKNGIGKARGFGFGMLQIVPVN